MELTEQTIAKLASALQALADNTGARSKAISGTPDYQSIFGVGGFFSNFGLDNTVVNGALTPRGIGDLIPAIGTNVLFPVFPYLTGFEDDGAAEPAGPCDDAPGGVIETCHQTAAFGRVTRGSKEMEVNELANILNGHLTTDLRLLGDVISPGHQLMPQQGVNQGAMLRQVVQTQMVIIAIMFQRWLTRQIWSGNPVNSNVGGGYAEFPGLDILISTNKVDAFTGVACPALYSDIKDFGYNSIDSSTPDILAYVSAMEFYLRSIAEMTNLMPVDWVIAMRRELFFELTAVWPCRYLTNRCAPSMYTAADGALRPGGAVVINDNNNVAMRDAMREGNYLTINGRNIPVVLDDGIPEDTNVTDARLLPGEYASDIYFLPIRAKGMSALYWEYMDYTPSVAEANSVMQGTAQFWATDGGRYLWSSQQRNYCWKIQAKIQPRVILKTPQLAGRIQNVKYAPLQHLREPFQDSPYFMKGGNEEYTNSITDLYSDWNLPLPRN